MDALWIKGKPCWIMEKPVTEGTEPHRWFGLAGPELSN